MQTKKRWRLGTRAQLLLRGLRYAPLLPYVSIDGWLTVDEAIALFELARGLPAERPLAVEIGSWQGKSSVVLAKGLAKKREPRLVCIDPFDCSGDPASAGEYAARAAGFAESLQRGFLQNVGDAGVRAIVDLRVGYSHDVAASFAEPIDLLFLDGDHAYAAAARDLRDWAPKVKPGGFLAVHDVVHPVHEGPRRAADELVRGRAEWIDVRTVDSMLIARRAGGSGRGANGPVSS